MEQFVEVEVKKEHYKVSKETKDIVLVFNLEKELTVRANDYQTKMEKNDIILFNAGTSFEVSGTDTLFACFTIRMRMFRQMFPGKRYHFLCDSTREIDDNYIRLQRILSGFLSVQYEGGEYQWAERYKLGCELVIFLVSNFSVMQFSEKNNEKLDEMIAYIAENFQSNLSLNQISDEFHMTAPYFSRYFKKNMGINFYQYLNKVRLEYATEDLLYSDKNLLYIAMDSGFPNVQSFNKYFVEAYGISPQKYREQHPQKKKEQIEMQRENLNQALSVLGTVKEEEDIALPLEIDVRMKQDYVSFWCEVINLNDFELLSNFEIREQFRYLQDQLHFKYARVNMKWDEFQKGELYSFYVEEQTFDFLLSNQLQLWFAIPLRQVTDLENFLAYLRKLLSHFLNRYDKNKVRQWRFELHYNTLYNEKKAKKYWEMYDQIQKILSEYQIAEPLLGAGIELGNWTEIKAFENYMEKTDRNLEVQTIQVESFVNLKSDHGLTFKRATDSSYVKNQLRTIRKNVPAFAEDRRQIYITNWSESAAKFNFLNDSCYRGAAVVKNVMDCFGMVGVFAHSVPLDLAYTDKKQDRVLFGGDGLLTKQGLKKPSFYAYQFLQNVTGRYITKNEHSIVFGNENPEYQIICHNCKNLSYHYYMEEGQLQFDHLNTYFCDEDELVLNYKFNHMKNGSYVVKIRSVSRESGSIQDEFRNIAPFESMAIPTYVYKDDLEYLRQIAVPHLELRVCNVENETLNLKIKLKANEFAYIHIDYTYL